MGAHAHAILRSIQKPQEAAMSTEVMVEFHLPLTEQTAESMSELAHIRPELRARLAPLESQGLLAAGIRAV